MVFACLCEKKKGGGGERPREGISYATSDCNPGLADRAAASLLFCFFILSPHCKSCSEGGGGGGPRAEEEEEGGVCTVVAATEEGVTVGVAAEEEGK